MICPHIKQSDLQKNITNAYRRDEADVVKDLLQQIDISADLQQRIATRAHGLVEKVRTARTKDGGIDAFMQQYDLSSEEGIALMCLAEALLRIPDSATIDKLLKDKIGSANWSEHVGTSDSMFVNAATWSLMLTGKLYGQTGAEDKRLFSALKSFVGRSGGGIVRKAVSQGMKLLGKQFVMGRNIKEALVNAKEAEGLGYLYSYDMLGEAAHTEKDAKRYFESYTKAIHAIGEYAANKGPIHGPGISIKLSALHPRYEVAKRERIMVELTSRLKALAVLAKKYNIGLTVDAEEADRLELSLEVIEKVFCDKELSGWQGFGLAVQAYQKRAPFVIDFLAEMARTQGRKLMLRLVKGAYWDTEVKLAQVFGFNSYPVFTRKSSTDVSYIACAQKLLGLRDVIYPQFATHNAHTLATIYECAGDAGGFEFQCLHGMGRPLYDEVVGAKNLNIPSRIYAPVGLHEDLLAYLVRRLLENGANSSFVNRITDEKEPIAKIIADPVVKTQKLESIPHPHIPLPQNIYGGVRQNSLGIDFSDYSVLAELNKELDTLVQEQRHAYPLVAGLKPKADAKNILSPTDTSRVVGTVIESSKGDCDLAVNEAHKAFEAWDNYGPVSRANLLDKFADRLEEATVEFMAIAIVEAGKTLPDAIAEVREAVDFCRYYAEQARTGLVMQNLPGPTGELNQLFMHGRGVFLCISPWNFPLAIFIGQVVAALVAGNCVLAKPAEQTPLIAMRAVELMHEVGFPQEVIQLLPGRGDIIGAQLVADEKIDGVMFTGSTETAKRIQKSLADRDGAIVPLVAETGGLNAMIVDSSALPEQVIVDVVASAFGSAGQRCSALRVLYLQNDVADGMIEMLVGAMAELKVSDPYFLSTDIGPVIDQDALEILQQHFKRMSQEGKLLSQVPMEAETKKGSFFAPCAFEIDSITQLTREVFGPFLHVIRYKAKDLDKIIGDIKGSGYGLTFGVHSRITETTEYLQQRMSVGNIYVNRNMIGAVVGVQPFGGEGLSGTGPKAGGPHYLPRLCAERTISINTTAAGGNATLLSLDEDD